MTDSQELDLLPGNVKKAVGGASSGDLWMLQRSLIRRHPKLQPRDNTTEHYKERVRHLADLMHANGYDRSFPPEGVRSPRGWSRTLNWSISHEGEQP
ncbi:hypothetical protein D5045_11990 [Verminephrobacter eiseniae]|uniref:hypothetical protein n=1 Tax=Verminephrobacter eiseniae TaxID=364317 RepID=UPI0022390098|nr:hypothetical protein [Verminephrobacter eiseniae]MCW5260889.1 hypothetical protein [Verminephrobacter eiseniae]